MVDHASVVVTKPYLDTLWNSHRLVIRVANGDWRGIDLPQAH